MAGRKPTTDIRILGLQVPMGAILGALMFVGGLAVKGWVHDEQFATKPWVQQGFAETRRFVEDKSAQMLKEAIAQSDSKIKEAIAQSDAKIQEIRVSQERQGSDIKGMLENLRGRQDQLIDDVRSIKRDGLPQKK